MEPVFAFYQRCFGVRGGNELVRTDQRSAEFGPKANHHQSEFYMIQRATINFTKFEPILQAFQLFNVQLLGPAGRNVSYSPLVGQIL